MPDCTSCCVKVRCCWGKWRLVVLYPAHGFFLSFAKRFGRGERAAVTLGASADGRTRQCILAELVFMVCYNEHGCQHCADTIWLRFSNIFFHQHQLLCFASALWFVRRIMRLYGYGLQV